MSASYSQANTQVDAMATTNAAMFGGDVSVGPHNNGKLGVGMLLPTSSIDVTGDLRVSSHITSSGNISSSGTLTVGSFSTDTMTLTHLTASGNISASGTIQSTGNISTDGSITATSADINGNVDIDGGNLTVGTALQLTNGGVFNFGGSLADGRITWDTGYASLYLSLIHI